jgi:hypothetical protein
MRKVSLMGAVAVTALFASPAFSTIIMVDASSIQGANVLFNNASMTGNQVFASTNLGTNTLRFTGATVGGGTAITANGGQARIEGGTPNLATNNPNDNLNLSSLNFGLTSGTFNNLEFNLTGASSGATALFTITDNEGQVFTFGSGGLNDPLLALGNGENFFGFQGINGESISNVSVAFSGGGVVDVRQIRLDTLSSVTAVPEPATWAMMLLGFGAVGYSMRRRRLTYSRAQAV